MTRQRKPSRLSGVYQYTVRDGKKWGATVEQERDWQTGKRRTVRKHGFRTQDEAHAWRVEQQDKRRRGDTVEPSMVPLGQWASDWLAMQRDKRPKSVIAYASRLTHLTDVLGAVPLSRVTPAMLDRLYGAFQDRGYKPATIQGFHRTYKTLFQRAVDQRLIAHNPAALVRPPSGGSKQPTVWTADELRQFLAVNGGDPYWGLIWRFMAETWVRVGELIALQWDAVDLEAGTVRIDRTITLDRDKTRMAGPPKSKAGRRTIAISRGLVDALRQHRDRQRFLPLTSAVQKWTTVVHRSDLVFPGQRTGSWLHQPAIADALKVACHKAGVPVLTPHEIRHTGATIADREGVNPKIISQRLGHSDVATTLRLYRHTDADEHRKAADQIGALMVV
jgi:integrase